MEGIPIISPDNPEIEHPSSFNALLSRFYGANTTQANTVVCQGAAHPEI